MIVRLLNRLFDHRVIINCEREPYLLRWYVLRTKRFSLFIHKFVRSDEDRALHDHPWAFLVIPIWRGYVEHSDREQTLRERVLRMNEWVETKEGMDSLRKRRDFRPAVVRRVWPLISAKYRPAQYRHRVELINGKPSWSIFFHFTKTREWGFYPAEGFVQWNKWWQKNCE